MSSALVRIALLQFIVVVLMVLADGFALKVRFGSGAHPPILATYVRDFGLFLLLVPTVWATWGALRANRPLAGAGRGGLVFVSGVVLFGLLVFLGFMSFMSALTYHSIMVHVAR